MPKFYEKDHLLESPQMLEAPHQMASSVIDQDDDLVRTLLTWRSPERPFRKKDRSYYTTVVTLVVLISLIALLLGERLLIGVLLAIAFVIYVLNFVPPADMDHKISTQGITIGDHFYHWDELDSFWFSTKEGHPVLHVLTHLRFPVMLILVLDNVDQEEVKKVCAAYLPFHEIAPKTIMDKWSESLQKHFPLENPHR